MDLISVIVPIYNVEDYLKQCINSLLKQTYTNLEILLIDDGSMDSSSEICDEYSVKDKRIKVFHQKNKGLSGARNTGIENMRGRYVTFVDSDDYVSEDYIKELYRILQETEADISCVSGNKFFGEKIFSNIEEKNGEKLKTYNRKEAFKQMLYRKDVNSYAWGKLFKNEMFNDVRFPEGLLFEDVRTIYKLYDKAEKIAICTKRLYYYRQRQGSIVNSGFTPAKMQQVTASEEIVTFVKDKYPELTAAAISKCFIAAVDVFRRIPQDGYFKEKEYLKKIIKKYRTSVLKDRENKILTKAIALTAVININFLNYAGQIYQKLVESGWLKNNNPI